MDNRKLCVIGGDGIGPEVTRAAVAVLQSVTDDIDIIYADGGWQTFLDHGDSVPEATLQQIQDCGAALFGAVSSPSKKVAGYRSAILKIRQEMELYANLRPIKSEWHPDPVKHDVDLLIVRENSEGLYSGRETAIEGEAIAEKVVTRQASLRIGQTAARVADQRTRKVLIAHKANVLPISDGLFRDCVREALAGPTESGNSIEASEGLADIVAYRLVACPEDFDVIVTTNMFGDILSDLAAFWCGGMGRAPSLNIGDSIAVAEPVHGSAPDIVGQDSADPSATILALSLLARFHWRDHQLADQLESVVTDATKQIALEDFSTEKFTALACHASSA